MCCSTKTRPVFSCRAGDSRFLHASKKVEAVASMRVHVDKRLKMPSNKPLVVASVAKAVGAVSYTHLTLPTTPYA